MKILHVHNHARFQGGVERILYDMASSLAAFGEQGLYYLDTEVDRQFLAAFAWADNASSGLDEYFNPDLVLFHKVDDVELISALCCRYPSLLFVHDHDLTCPRRHKYVPGADQPCVAPVGLGCIRHLCFVEPSETGSRLPFTLFKGFVRQARQMKAYRKVRAYIVASRHMANELDANGVDKRRIQILAPVPKAIELGSALKLPEQPNLLFVGQLVKGKGLDLLLAAMAIMDEPCNLTIVGEGNHRKICEGLVSKLGLKSRVDFVGLVEFSRLQTFYRNSQLVVMPSRWPEPFGMVGVEAMSRARPVVAFNCGGISAWLQDGITGRLVEPGDINALARTLDELLADKPLRERLSRNAYDIAKRRFTHRGFILEIKDIMEGVLDEDTRLRLCR